MTKRGRILLVSGLVAVAGMTNLSVAGGQGAGEQTDDRSTGDLAAADLAAADGLGYATPVATLLRIPNELPGGALLSKTTLTLDKTQAVTAGYTPGELGEAFLHTTVVPPEELPDEMRDQLAGVVAWENPTLVTAQTPASAFFPAEAAIAEGGLHFPPVEAASLRASTSERTAEADAIGGLAIRDSNLTIGSGGSRSRSRLLDDGTVVSEAHAFLEDVRLAGGLLRIAGINTIARVELRPGHEPVQDLKLEIAGAEVLGVPAVIDQDGIRVADTSVLGLGELAAVNDILSTLADQGLSVTLFPGIVEEADDRSVRVAGAALSIRGVLTDYVPTSADTPIGPVGSPYGDVGTDNEILLGQVEASAFAVERSPLPGFGLPELDLSVLPSPESTTESPDLPSAAAAAPPGPTTPPVVVKADEDSSQGSGPGSGDGAFGLIRQQELPGVAALRAGYRWVLLAALAGSTAHFVRRNTRFV